MHQNKAFKAGFSVIGSVRRMLGEDDMEIVAGMLGESAHEISDLLAEAGGPVDRVVGWLARWNLARPHMALAMRTSGPGGVSVLPEALPAHFELRALDDADGYRLWVRTAPDAWRAAPGVVTHPELERLPIAQLAEAWETLPYEEPISVRRVLQQASQIRWDRCSTGTGDVCLRRGPRKTVWEGHWWLAAGRNVAAFKIVAPDAGHYPMVRIRDVFHLDIGSVTIETREVTIVSRGRDDCVIVIRPAPVERELLDAIADRRGATLFQLEP